MFQYAFIKACSERNWIDFKIDINEFQTYKLHKYCLEVFNIQSNYSLKKEIPFYENFYSNYKVINLVIALLKNNARKINNNHIIEKDFSFDPKLLKIKKWYIEGYFQTEKYFLNFADKIREDFTFTIEPSEKNYTCIQEIKSSESISLHIRRWDFINNTKTNTIHWTCDLEYYKKASQYIIKKLDKPIFYIFSDDIKWVKENLNIEWKVRFIDWNNAEKNYEDMRLMSLCKHNIIANSSFSWWWAWLNKNKSKIVISPKKWFNTDKINTKDIIPDTWIKI